MTEKEPANHLSERLFCRSTVPITRIRFLMFILSSPLPWWFLLWRTVLPGEAGTVAHGPGRLAAAFAQ
ncbi:MAG: hypothetical protein ACTHL6_04210 [Arthrobacter sp.]